MNREISEGKSMCENILEMRNICKSFPGVKALQDVSLTVLKGEVHCILGENGAGKSTLIKILAGAYPKDSGEIVFDGKILVAESPMDVLHAGISFIHQELSVFPALTVEENITMGWEDTRFKAILDKKKNTENASQMLRSLKINISPSMRVSDLSASQKQMMLIARALSQNAKLIVMDEPTAALTAKETEALFDLVRRLKERNISFIFVSHRLKDIFSIGDSLTIFRDGRNVVDAKVSDVDESFIISNMVGRSMDYAFPRRERNHGIELLRMENVFAQSLLKNICFTLHKGEALGVSGLAGAGKTELANAIFGLNPVYSGTIYLRGKKVRIKSPKQAMRHGIALVPEERRAQAIVAGMSVRWNISLAISEKISKYGIINGKRDSQIAQDSVRKFSVKTPSIEQALGNLSGGNQQKVVLAKWIATDADIILLDEPTRGIDVGAKREIYTLVNQLIASGKSIILFSSELVELIGMCDRIAILHEGELVHILDSEDATEEQIMYYSVGGT